MKNNDLLYQKEIILTGENYEYRINNFEDENIICLVYKDPNTKVEITFCEEQLLQVIQGLLEFLPEFKIKVVVE